MPGWIAFSGLLGLVGLALGGLLYWAPTVDVAAALNEGETWRIVRFTLWQAALSTLISVALALPFARALARRTQFWGRSLLIWLSSLSLVIPTMVAVFGIAMVYGRSGWLNHLLSFIDLDDRYTLYGLNGILIAHVFFNLPLATRFMLSALESLPGETWRLSAQLGLPPSAIFRLIEWPLLRGVMLNVAGLIFMLCFTSFAIVLSLGGGPKASTLEVAIYQAIRFDFDIGQGVALAFIQIAICLGLLLISRRSRTDFHFQISDHARYSRPDAQNLITTIIDAMVIALTGVFLLSPLIAVFVRSMSPQFWSIITSPSFIQASFTSLSVSLSAATLALALSLPIAFLSKNLIAKNAVKRSIVLDLGSALILVVPPLTLGMGLFLVFRSFTSILDVGLYLVILVNGLLAVPFAVHILRAPISASAQQVDRLSDSLGIAGWARLKLIYWPQIRRPLAFAFAIAATLSLGDMGVIALFGTQDLTTLPLLIYRLFGAYKMDEAAVVAMMLCLACFALFWAIERVMGGPDQYAQR